MCIIEVLQANSASSCNAIKIPQAVQKNSINQLFLMPN